MARRPADMPEPEPEDYEAAQDPEPAPRARAVEAGDAAPRIRPNGNETAPRARVEVEDEAAPRPRASSAPASARPASVESQGGDAPAAASEREFAAPSYAPAAPPVTALRDKRVGFIGAGAIGGALCRGLVNAGAALPNRILISDPHAERVQSLQKTLGLKVAESNLQVAKYTDVIVLAVKPYNVAPVLDEISESLKRDAGKPLPLLVCIAAGVSLATIEAHLKEPLPVVRAMPNIPAQVGKGACAYCRGTHADDAHAAQAAEIFRSVGIALEVPENQMDGVTALSGSGPAYVYLMIEALVDGGVKVGLPREIAHQLAAQTVLGAAQMVIETGMHPAQLRDMVTTPAGTTIEALAALEHSGLRAALIDAVGRAAARSRELG